MRKQSRKKKKSPAKIIILIIFLLALIGGGVYVALNFEDLYVKFFVEMVDVNEEDLPDANILVSNGETTVIEKEESSSSEENSSSQESESSSEIEEDEDKVDASEWSLILVNDDVKIPDGYEFEQVYVGGMIVDERIEEPLSDMLNDASAAGVSLWIASAYRDQELQSILFERRVQRFMYEEGMTEEEAREITPTRVKAPGHSEHETGLAVDFNTVTEEFEDTAGFAWLMENAADYGFILRYEEDTTEITKVDYEPWHFRYVGEEHAKAIVEMDVTLEEYLDS